MNSGKFNKFLERQVSYFLKATLPLKPATIALKIGHLAFQVLLVYEDCDYTPVIDNFFQPTKAINTKQKFRQNLLSGLKATIVLCECGGKPGHSQVPTQRIFFS